MEDFSKRTRFLSPDQAASIFALQMQILPEISEEVTKLSGGSIGVVKAIISTMGEKISEEPDVEVSPDFIRETLGAPEDPVKFEQWREGFWDDFKLRSQQA